MKPFPFYVLLTIALSISTVLCEPSFCKSDRAKSYLCSGDEGIDGYDTILADLANDTFDLLINGGRFSELGGRPFENFAQLEILWIIGSRLEVIKDSAFIGLIQLKVLTINGKLKTVEENTFTSCPMLETINFPHNQIVNLLPFTLAMAPLTNLRKVEFLDNPTLESVHENDFAPLRDSPLSIIQFTRCNIRKIGEGAFSHLTILRRLFLSENPLDEENLANALFNITSELNFLELNNVNVTEIPRKALDHLSNTKIEELSMKNNKFQTIPAGSFPKMPNLIDLSLSYGSLEWIDAGVFENWPTLQKLDVSYNNKLTILFGRN
uniref:LRRNT domain-containing protein n=1 Tax=Strigamia maritima TaxID=126957 RepID=T1JC42_STRMM